MSFRAASQAAENKTASGREADHRTPAGLLCTLSNDNAVPTKFADTTRLGRFLYDRTDVYWGQKLWQQKTGARFRLV